MKGKQRNVNKQLGNCSPNLEASIIDELAMGPSSLVQVTNTEPSGGEKNVNKQLKHMFFFNSNFFFEKKIFDSKYLRYVQIVSKAILPQLM